MRVCSKDDIDWLTKKNGERQRERGLLLCLCVCVCVCCGGGGMIFMCMWEISALLVTLLLMLVVFLAIERRTPSSDGLQLVAGAPYICHKPPKPTGYFLESACALVLVVV